MVTSLNPVPKMVPSKDAPTGTNEDDGRKLYEFKKCLLFFSAFRLE